MDDHTRKGTKHVYTFTSKFPTWRSYSSKLTSNKTSKAFWICPTASKPKKLILMHVWKTRWLLKTSKISLFDQTLQKMHFWSYKYRFSLQKEVKNQKYFFIIEKYNITAFQRTFDRFHIFKISEDTTDPIFMSRAS